MSQNDVPDFTEFREIVDHIIDPRNAHLIKVLYLFAARASEVVKTTATERARRKGLGTKNQFEFRKRGDKRRQKS